MKISGRYCILLKSHCAFNCSIIYHRILRIRNKQKISRLINVKSNRKRFCFRKRKQGIYLFQKRFNYFLIYQTISGIYFANYCSSKFVQSYSLFIIKKNRKRYLFKETTKTSGNTAQHKNKNIKIKPTYMVCIFIYIFVFNFQFHFKIWGIKSGFILIPVVLFFCLALETRNKLKYKNTIMLFWGSEH